MQIKVNNIKKHKGIIRDGKFISVPVVESKLVLINKANSHYILPHPHAFWLSNVYYQPIIISETEKIEVGDKFLFQGKHIEIAGRDGIKNYYELENDYGKTFKILALPEHFSPKQLEDIVQGRLKDGQKVLIECDGKTIYPGCESYQCNHPLDPVEYTCDNPKCDTGCIKEEFIQFIKLAPYVHIYPMKEKMYTYEEVEDIAMKWFVHTDITDLPDGPVRNYFKNWFNKNIK